MSLGRLSSMAPAIFLETLLIISCTGPWQGEEVDPFSPLYPCLTLVNSRVRMLMKRKFRKSWRERQRAVYPPLVLGLLLRESIGRGEGVPPLSSNLVLCQQRGWAGIAYPTFGPIGALAIPFLGAGKVLNHSSVGTGSFLAWQIALIEVMAKRKIYLCLSFKGKKHVRARGRKLQRRQHHLLQDAQQLKGRRIAVFAH